MKYSQSYLNAEEEIVLILLVPRKYFHEYQQMLLTGSGVFPG